MIAEFGHYLLALAFAVAVLQGALLALTVNGATPPILATLTRVSRVQFLLLLVSFAALIAVFVQSDFSVRTVVENSHTAKPLIYRVAGAWGNHEGSMLLWVVILALFGALLTLSPKRGLEQLIALALGVQGLVGAAFLAFILFTSNPFARLDPAPVQGMGLNPVLQDPALALHPPLLYVGYVGFSVTFALACAALIDGRINAAFGRLMRVWSLIAWVALTCGIALGSYWAYYELGWGGYWFWDPVENASLLPWLAGTALLHSAIVLERREGLKAWTVLLALLAFAMSLLGTFLVRSGVLTSVHAFANDPARGLVILIMFAIFVGGGLALFAWRAPQFRSGGMFMPISREGALVANNLLLTTGAGVVLFGTLYPIILSSFSDELISVGPPYFNLTIGLLTVPLMVLLPLGPRLAWRRADVVAAMSRLWIALGAAIAGVALIWSMSGGVPFVLLLFMAGGLWLMFGALSDLAARAGAGTVDASVFSQRLLRLPRSAFGVMLAHAGLGVLLLGISISSAFKEEGLAILQEGESVAVGRYSVTLENVTRRSGPNYAAEVSQFSVEWSGRAEPVISERRIYQARGTETTEVGLVQDGLSQLYIVAGPPQRDGWGIRAYFNPYITLIWWGPVLMSVGGLLSLSDRRLRLGALKPKVTDRMMEAVAT